MTKILIFRLSSLGDVILSTAALEALRTRAQSTQQKLQIEWVVSSDFAEVLRGHPQIAKLHEFARPRTLKSWVTLCRQLWLEGFDEVIDLHGSLRSLIARFLFWKWSRSENPELAPTIWTRISKQRFRFYGYYLFKRFWPQVLRPKSLRWIASRAGGATEAQKPSMDHLLLSSPRLPLSLDQKKYFCVMPSSKWNGKQWDVEKYLEVLGHFPHLIPVVLGTRRDAQSVALVRRLELMGRPVVSGVEVLTLAENARVLLQAQFFLGNDTGLFHLAEALNTPSVVVLGPTCNETGYGPWNLASVSVGRDLLCRPCGKAGAFCHRFWDSHACLKGLDSTLVVEAIHQVYISSGAEIPSKPKP